MALTVQHRSTGCAVMQCMSTFFTHLLCLTLLFDVMSAQVRLREENVLLLNRPVLVPSGRTVFVDPLNHLRIRVRPGDMCEIIVQNVEDFQYRPGRLNTPTFPCDFGPRQVEYSHFGGRSLFEDRVRMMLRYDTASETLIFPFTVVFKIVEQQLEIVRKNVPIVVTKLMGFSTPINSQTLDFTFDRQNSKCKVTVLSRASGLPRYGYVYNDTSSLSGINCDDFVTKGIRYKHHANANTPNRDYIPLEVQLVDFTGKMLKQEYFQVNVRITVGHENTRPEASSEAYFVMDSINQFIMTAITPKIVSATDRETSSDKLLYNISQPLGPGEGAIVSTDDRNLEIESFYQYEINNLKIAYKPPASDSNVKRMFQLELQIFDSDGLKSDPLPLMIIVEPMSTLSPIVTTNTGIQLLEGESRPLVSPQVLQISDEDNLNDVRIYHIDGMGHGHLILPGGRNYFTPVDLRRGSVVYQHDGSDTSSDNIIFRMTDGTHAVEFLFPVTIFPLDDQPPALMVNTGLELQKSDIAEINQFILSALDTDSDDSEVTFILEPPYSQEGILIKRQFQMPVDPRDWQYKNGIYQTFVNKFTQEELLQGKIFYRHVGGHHTDVVMDSFSFRLADGGDPPNMSPVYRFVIKVLPVDDQLPYLDPNVRLQLDVNEFELVSFRRKNLRFTDDDSNDRELLYKIVRQPFDTYTQGPADAGRIVYCDTPSQEILKFTQAEVNHQRVCYNPPSTDLGITARKIRFDFSVEDVAGNVLTEQKFTIDIHPVDNKPPDVTNGGLVIFENDNAAITPQVLDVHDSDTEDGKIEFILTKEPKHGILYQRQTPLQEGDTFSKSSITQGDIIYRNIGDKVEATSDRIHLDVTDGVHFVPIIFKILIQPVDDEPPTLPNMTDQGTASITLECRESDSVMLRRRDFYATDRDTDVMLLTFIVERRPRYGRLLLNRALVDRFTQRDLIEGHVTYEHTSGEIGADVQKDSFRLMLTDETNGRRANGKKFSHVDVNVKVMPVDNQEPDIILGPNLDVIEGDKAAILPFHLDARDVDTDDDDILCTLVIQPQIGYIENLAPQEGSEKSRAGMPISAFSIRNVRLGNINYVQSVHKGSEPTEDHFTFQCTDGLNVSPQFRMMISIYPANDEEPELHVREFTGSEGMEIRIDLPILNALDADVPADTLHFIITSPPSHGAIVQQTRDGYQPISNFTLEDIKAYSTIVYEHDDSETREDEFSFTLTDGVHNVTKTVPILIFPVDDETPRLVVNTGLEIENIGDILIITNTVLKADDLDSSIPNITFIIRKVPQQGYLRKMDDNNQKVNLTLNSNFTQWDIDHMHVEYCHTGTEGKRDLIKFDITDGLNPLIDRYFYITIAGIDIIYPEVINRGVELPEGGIVVLTTNLISGTDINSPDSLLIFTVTRAPSHGYIELTDNIGIPILTFTQLDLASTKVRYVHNSGSEIKIDSFEFEVTDGLNPVSRTFRIALTDVDNKKPVLMLGVLRLKEAGSKLVTPFELSAKDSDTIDEKIIFTITQVPLHGNLLYNYSRIVSRFSMSDLINNLISYQHDGTETSRDSFSFTVNDGVHAEFFVPGSPMPTRHPQEMEIEIIAVDNGVPQISINKGGTVLTPLGRDIGFQFNNKILRSDDPDSSVENLLYTLTLAPKHGYIRNIRRGDGGVSTWTQGDIDQMLIQYILNPGENATSDSFFFKISDHGNNVLANQPFHLNWAWISFEKDALTVNETEEYLVVNLRRRGYLGETCFVTINVTDRTATVGEDVSRMFAQQVQFNPGQSEKSWKIRLRDDQQYEEQETLILQLLDPVSAVIEYPEVAIVTILDPEDESTVYIPEKVYRVQEKVSQVDIPIHRTGDVSTELMVICSTLKGTATGTKVNRVQSFSDYITRPEDHTSIIRFDRDEDNKFCRVMVIDDSLYEQEEQFTVVLSSPMGGRLGNQQNTTIVIEMDKFDEPVFYFGQEEYVVDESAGFVEVKVWKTGTDLSGHSGVTVRSRRTDPVSAESGIDYVAVNRILDFAPGVMTQTVKVNILDDLGLPQLEGLETFELVLRMPREGSLGEPNKARIVINDTVSDMPQMEFREPQYEVLETEDEVVAIVTRSGDLGQVSMVRCYTRQSTAEVMLDYVERPDTNASFVFFQPGEREAECRVNIVNDDIRETEETFRLVLGTPDSTTAGGATVGGQNTAKVTIYDPEDKPLIKFEENRYTVNEPIIKGDMTILRVAVIRQGDARETSEVRVSTKDGSARAGRDYNGFSKLLKFKPVVRRQFADIQINFDGERENGETFSVHLSNDRYHIASVKINSRAIIYIEEKSKLADVIFPVPPIVVSLRDYDNVEEGQGRQPIQGYPLVCVSPCDVKHPQYPVVSRLCHAEGINSTLTKFRWRVSAPSSSDGVSSQLIDLEANTYFTSTRQLSLDSIYFGGGCRVQCLARAVNLDGEPGKELASSIVTVSVKEGLCLPRVLNSVGAEPYTARLRYTGPDDLEHPNTVRLSVLIPHRDGMLPSISTSILSNFELALSPDGIRQGQHRCSNLLNFDEVTTRFGFLTNETRNIDSMGEMEPYQYSSELRGESTLRFYRNLDLESCLWEFVSYFEMSELVSDCGGRVQTDGQVLNSMQSYVSLVIPLFVSYIFHSPMATGGWRNYDMRSNLRLTFVYDTSILWQEGVASPSDESGLHGQLYPTSMRIQKDGTLSVQFRTEARFRGLFLVAHPGMVGRSTVICLDQPELTFSLNLVRSEPTFDQPEQLWELVSNMAVKDYSGDYQVRLIPCTTSANQQYSMPVICNPSDLVTFDLPIRFQQVSDPVPTEYSLDTQFSLIRKRDLWLSDGTMGYTSGTDSAFAPGDLIYGRVDVNPVQSLGDQFHLDIEKVFLCAGRDGYIPKYDPDNKEFGCVAESSNLQQVYRILDKGAPHTQDESMNGLPFKARLAVDDSKARDLIQQPGSDGFSFDSTPLFQIDSGRNWFLHTIYTIRSKENSQKGRGKRDVDEEFHIVRRSAADVQSIGQSGLGTNMAPLQLDADGSAYVDNSYDLDQVSEKHDGHMSLVAIIVGVGLLFIICLFVAVIFIRHRRKHSSPPPSPSGTITILSGKGSSRIVVNGHTASHSGNTEV